MDVRCRSLPTHPFNFSLPPAAVPRLFTESILMSHPFSCRIHSHVETHSFVIRPVAKCYFLVECRRRQRWRRQRAQGHMHEVWQKILRVVIHSS